MAKETITIQCYPDDSIINKRIKEYEAFGWELIGNQHCQEYEGQTSSSNVLDGSTTVTRHYSSFNKLTFSREKSEPWYGEVVKLENEYKGIMNKKPSEPYKNKLSKPYIYFACICIIVGCALLAFSSGSTALLAVGLILLIGIIILTIVLFVRKSIKNKTNYSYYQSRLYEWEKSSKVEAEKIMAQANRLVNS